MYKKFINALLPITLFIIIIFILFNRYIVKKDVIYFGKYGFLIVLSESMKPNIDKYELIIIKKDNNYDLNDIVTYKSEGNILITHRIIEIDDNSFVAKGDNNRISDKSVEIQNIKGKVIFHSKRLGIFIMFYLKSVILGYICIVLFIYVKKMIFKGENDEIEEEENIDSNN